MRLCVRRFLPALAGLFIILTPAAAAYACGETHARKAAAPLNVDDRIALYSPRVRRSTILYLRLRLLELREEGLDRARAAIEHRLSIDELLAEPAHPGRTEFLPNGGPHTQPPVRRKAKGESCRTVGP